MALKGLDIFKLTPKTNCKECGSPTCMAFAMKVAQGAVALEKCPHMGADVIAKLAEANDRGAALAAAHAFLAPIRAALDQAVRR